MWSSVPVSQGGLRRRLNGWARAPLTTASANATESLALGLARDLAPLPVNAVCLGLIITEQGRVGCGTFGGAANNECIAIVVDFHA